MRYLNQIHSFCILFVTLLFVHLSNNASLDAQDRYKTFTGDQGLYTQKDDVEILTVDNFKDAIVGSKKAWLVEFYNSWCGFCQRFAPSWKEFATDVRNWRDLVVVAALDCSNEQNYNLCRDYEIMGYPTLRYYHEGFQEEPKNYGFVMNRGTTTQEHRQDLVSKMISEQREGRGKQFPNLLPYSAGNINGVFDETSSDVKYAIMVAQEPQSLLGPELIMDLHKIPNIVTHYTLTNNTDLITILGASSFPALFVIGRDQHMERMMSNSNDREGFIEALKRHFKMEDFKISLDKAGSQGAAELEQKKHEEDELMQKVKKMGDVVFQMDLESALRYSLKREVGGSKEITGEKLAALRKYLQLLKKYFPFGRNGKALLAELSDYADNNEVVSGQHIGQTVKSAENEERQVFSTPQQWLGCRGSSKQYRGYPCGLWKMFHYLTVNVADYDAGLRGDNPRLALETMHGYIKHFFGCSDCSQHFQDMAARREIDKVATFDDSIVWLWMAHNEVNKRLSGDDTEDPEFPKIQFPSETNCPRCHKTDGSWDFAEVLKYLKHMYSSLNVRYLGADTKVIYLGLDDGGDNGTTTHAGLQEEAVQIQTRSPGEGVVGLVGPDGAADGVSSLATTKDKNDFVLPVVFVLTVLYAKDGWFEI